MKPYKPTAQALAAANRARAEQADRRYARAIELRRQGLTNAEISAETGIPTKSIYRVMGATPKRFGGKGVWDLGLHERVVFLRELDWTIQEISDETGVPTSTCSDWIRASGCSER